MTNNEFQETLRSTDWEAFRKVKFHMSNGEVITLRQKAYRNSAGEKVSAVLTFNAEGDFIAYNIRDIKGWCPVPITEIISFEPTRADHSDE